VHSHCFARESRSKWKFKQSRFSNI
jgi:hypothetical protein